MVNHALTPSCMIAFSERNDGSKRHADILEWTKIHIPKKKLVYALLVHGTRCVVAETSSEETYSADVLVTSNPDVALGMSVGDCLPIVLCDDKHGTRALIHGGWKNLLAGVLPAALETFTKFSGDNLKKVRVWIGPSIQECCNRWHDLRPYDASPEWKSYIHKQKDGYHINMQAYVIATLKKRGVPQENIVNDGGCTYHERETYFSHRRAIEEKNRKDDGRMGAVVWSM